MAGRELSKARKQRPTLKDIARKVGVHVSTVSRALDARSRSRVAPELVEKIERVAARSGYQPNTAARALKTRRSRTIGVIIPDIADPAFPPIIRGIEDGLAAHDYVAILASTDGNPRRQGRIIEVMRARGVDGFILASVLRHDPAIAKLTAGLPVATVTRQTDVPRFSSVLYDEDDAFRLAVTHLLSLGHRSIATIAGPQSLSTGYNRHEAFKRHAKPLGRNGKGYIAAFARAFNESEGERCTEELLISGRAFTAIVCANDRLAVGAIAALRRHGLRCPEDVSVTGFNDMPLADRLSPPLTTVRVPHFRAGTEVAETIVDLVERDSAGARHLVLPVELVVRSSTQRAARGYAGRRGAAPSPI
jgi:LacI family transcriptional regulator